MNDSFTNSIFGPTKPAKDVMKADRLIVYQKAGWAMSDFTMNDPTKTLAHLGGFKFKVDETGDIINVVCATDDIIPIKI